MSVEKVRAYLEPYGVADRIREFDVSSATVELAALAVGVEGARIAVGGGDVITVRAKKAEQLLIGSEITDEVLEKVGVQAADEMNPRSSLHATAEYRYDMIRVYTKRAINEAIATMRAE